MSGSISRPALQLSFHPQDADRLCSSGYGLTVVWTIERLWDRHDLVAKHVQLLGYEHTCHCWYPQVGDTEQNRGRGRVGAAHAR